MMTQAPQAMHSSLILYAIVGDVLWGHVLGEFVGDGFEQFVCFGIYPCSKGGVVREHDMYDGKTYQKRADSCEEDKGK